VARETSGWGRAIGRRGRRAEREAMNGRARGGGAGYSHDYFFHFFHPVIYTT
jgi:hypothetical protein